MHAFLWVAWVVAAGPDGGTAAAKPLQLAVTDSRPAPRQGMTRDEARTGILRILDAGGWTVADGAPVRVRVDLSARTVGSDVNAQICARVTARIERVGQEFLPTSDIVSERCAPRDGAAGQGSFDVSRLVAASDKGKSEDRPKDGYVEALGEVMSTVLRRLPK